MAKKAAKKSVKAATQNAPEKDDDGDEENGPKPTSAPTSDESQSKPTFDLTELFNVLLSSFHPDATRDAEKKRDDAVREFIQSKIDDNPITKKYNIIILYDEGTMVKSDADHVYAAATKFRESKPVLLVLYSTGGAIGSAYLIGKLCRECSHEKLIVVVPRQAKSAATLICCAADEIHMGSLSELGPIDPQIDKLPALGLKTSVEHIADLIEEYPHAAEMFASYLNKSLQPIHLGYYERVAESAMQYAERLLKLHPQNLKQKPSNIAKTLVYSYKDHGFVIDKAEAAEIFGDDIVKTNTDEYIFGNDVYEAMKLIANIAGAFNHYFYFIGSPDGEPHFNRRGT